MKYENLNELCKGKIYYKASLAYYQKFKIIDIVDNIFLIQNWNEFSEKWSTTETGNTLSFESVYDTEVEAIDHCLNNVNINKNELIDKLIQLSEHCDELQRRGMLTGRVKQISSRLLGYRIDTKELRLMPYIIDVMMNYQKIDPRKINKEERDILSKWRKSGYIEGGVGGISVTKEFWDKICDIVYAGYVDLDE